jgi:hypothetical protein
LKSKYTQAIPHWKIKQLYNCNIYCKLYNGFKTITVNPPPHCCYSKRSTVIGSLINVRALAVDINGVFNMRDVLCQNAANDIAA